MALACRSASSAMRVASGDSPPPSTYGAGPVAGTKAASLSSCCASAASRASKRCSSASPELRRACWSLMPWMLRASSSRGLRSMSPWVAASVRTESQAARSSGASRVWPRWSRSRSRMAWGLVAGGGGGGSAAR
uniref:Uncharacterized protein n=1 Tax=Human herpesvirus 2 TaxID=10310 RepID=A0A481T4X1_HHV2|nr:hypothetical protein [Human alphaherpesvirus 2]